jgi:hypothetical protein
MPTLVDKTPPSSFARKKFIDPVRNKRTQNVDLEPTKLDVLKLNKTLPQGVSVKPQVDLYKSLDPAIVPDVPASYIQQPDRSFQALVAQPDQFHKYQTTQREAEESVGFFLDQELKREMAETNLNPYMYSRKQARAENELNRLINQPSRRLTPQEIFALENRILGSDPRLLPDYSSLSYIVRHSALLDFIRDRKIFTNMTAWKTSFMNVLNNTFARLRISKPEWFNTVLADNGKDPLLTAGVDLSGFQNMTAGVGHPTEPSAPSREVRREPTGERTIVHTAPPTQEIPDETLLKRFLNHVNQAIGSEAITKELAISLYNGQYDGYAPIRIVRELPEIVNAVGDINQYMASSKLGAYGAGMEYFTFVLSGLQPDMLDEQTRTRVENTIKKVEEEIKRATIASESQEPPRQDRSFLVDAENAMKLSGDEQNEAIRSIGDRIYERNVYKKPVEVAAMNIVMQEFTARLRPSAYPALIGNILTEMRNLLSEGAYKNEKDYLIAQDVDKEYAAYLKKKRP